MLSGFWKAAARGLDTVRWAGTGGQGYSNWGSNARLLPSTEIDYSREAGILWLCATVAPILNFATEQFREAPIQMLDETDPTAPKPIDTHPLLDLLDNPHPDISPEMLWDSMVINRLCGGNGFFRIVPSKGFAINPRTQLAGRIAQLVPTQYWTLVPQWPADGSQFISHYQYRVEGFEQSIDKRLVLHFRDRYDPLNPRVGMSRLQAVLREVCTDNEAGTATAALMRNRGMGNLIISPKEPTGANGILTQWTPEQRATLKEVAAEKMTGDRRGEALVPSIAVDVKEVGFEPDKMAFDKIRNLSADKILAAYNVDAMALGLPSSSKTYSNFQEAERAAVKRLVFPMWTQTEYVLNHQMMRVFYADDYAKGYRLRFDLSRVAALQERQDDLAKRLVIASGGPILTPNEARSKFGGLPEIEGGDELRVPVARAGTALEPNDEKRGE